MKSTTTTGTAAPVPVGAGAPASGAYHPTRAGRAFRLAFVSPVLYFLGAIGWLIGAALSCGAYPRDLGLVISNNGVQNASGILYIIASVCWIFGALVSIVAAHGEAVALHVGGKIPGIARIAILAAWLELLGAILLLIGAAVYTAAFFGQINEGTAGGILFLIGSFIYLVSQSLLMITALIVASVTSLMPEMSLRQRAWHSIASQFMFLLGMSFFVVGAACYVTQSLGLLASLLWLVASTMWIVAFFVRLRGTWLYFVPLMAFATAAAATSGAVAGTAAQAGVTGVGRGDLERGGGTLTGPVPVTGVTGAGLKTSTLPGPEPVPGVAAATTGAAMAPATGTAVGAPVVAAPAAVHA